MRHQKPLTLRIFIRICVIFMAISLIWVYVVYMFAPQEEAWENVEDFGTWWFVMELTWDDVLLAEEQQIILPEVDPENPENTEAPILVTEDGEIDEMNQVFEVQLENGETEYVSQWDLWDSIQIAQ